MAGRSSLREPDGVFSAKDDGETGGKGEYKPDASGGCRATAARGSTEPFSEVMDMAVFDAEGLNDLGLSLSFLVSSTLRPAA